MSFKQTSQKRADHEQNYFSSSVARYFLFATLYSPLLPKILTLNLTLLIDILFSVPKFACIGIWRRQNNLFSWMKVKTKRYHFPLLQSYDAHYSYQSTASPVQLLLDKFSSDLNKSINVPAGTWSKKIQNWVREF